jgi:hypothetical protein
MNNGYCVLFGENIKANENSLQHLLDEMLKKYTRVIVIADNVHKSGAEDLFKLFNNFSGRDSQNIHFLFSARENQLYSATMNLDGSTARAVNYAIKMMRKLEVRFDINDAKVFLRKALSISRPNEILNAEKEEEIANRLYEYSKADLLIFTFQLKYYITSERLDAINYLALS